MKRKGIMVACMTASGFGLAALFASWSLGVSPSAVNRSSEACADYDIESALKPVDRYGYFVDPSRLPIEVLSSYRQMRFALEDPVSDYALAATSMTMPAKIWWTIFKKKDKWDANIAAVWKARPCANLLFELPEKPEVFPYVEGAHPWLPLATEIAQIENLPVSAETKGKLLDLYHAGKIGLEGDLNPLRAREMARMFEQVVFEEWLENGIEPSVGEFHEWSWEFLGNYRRKFTPVSQFSKLMIGLSRGVTDLFMITGKEKELREYILEQPLRGNVEPYNGITLDQLFRASYRLNEGNVYTTLLTIENILALQWRERNREALASTLRLRPIINYFGNGADHYGSWYHLFGIMLYGFTTSLPTAKFVAFTETAGSHVLSVGEKETQENYINSKGAKIGPMLRKIIEKKTYLKGPRDPGFLVPEYYLDLNEDFTARLMKLARMLERKQ